MKTSNFERVQIEPKQKRLAPFESFTAEVTAKIAKYVPCFLIIQVGNFAQSTEIQGADKDSE